MKRVHHHRPHENQFCHWPSLVDLRMSDRGTEYYRCVFEFLYRFQRSALTCRSHEGVQTHTVREWPLGALELMEAW